MIKNILFDFDGVIIDSVPLKGQAFAYIFREFGVEKQEQIVEYHLANGGVSRFDKIEYFYNEILGEEITGEQVEHYANKFSNYISQKLRDSGLLILEVVEFIKNNHKIYNMHVVSASEDGELKSLCQYHGLSQYFKTVAGSPRKKNLLVSDVMNKFGYDKSETILIGDAITDYNAATANNISFIGYNNSDLEEISNMNFSVGEFCSIGSYILTS